MFLFYLNLGQDLPTFNLRAPQDKLRLRQSVNADLFKEICFYLVYVFYCFIHVFFLLVTTDQRPLIMSGLFAKVKKLPLFIGVYVVEIFNNQNIFLSTLFDSGENRISYVYVIAKCFFAVAPR